MRDTFGSFDFEEDTEQAHIVYLHADVLVKSVPGKEPKALDYTETLSTDKMYKDILSKLGRNNKTLRVAKKF